MMQSWMTMHYSHQAAIRRTSNPTAIFRQIHNAIIKLLRPIPRARPETKILTARKLLPRALAHDWPRLINTKRGSPCPLYQNIHCRHSLSFHSCSEQCRESGGHFPVEHTICSSLIITMASPPPETHIDGTQKFSPCLYLSPSTISEDSAHNRFIT